MNALCLAQRVVITAVLREIEPMMPSSQRRKKTFKMKAMPAAIAKSEMRRKYALNSVAPRYSVTVNEQYAGHPCMPEKI